MIAAATLIGGPYEALDLPRFGTGRSLCSGFYKAGSRASHKPEKPSAFRFQKYSCFVPTRCSNDRAPFAAVHESLAQH
jgi:hypothetical protein